MSKGSAVSDSILLSRVQSTVGVGLFAAACLVLFSMNLRASSGTEGAAFLDIPVGAGPAALGSAYTALASDAYAPIYNPAGLGFLNNAEVAAQHLSYLESINYEFGSFVLPLSRRPSAGHEGATLGALGFAVQYLGTGDITQTNPDGTSANAPYSDHYAAYSLAYGRKIRDNLSLGATGKAVQGKLADVSATAYAADLGALYAANEKLALAATLTNLGSKLTFENEGDSLPLAFHLGAAYKIENHLKSTVEGVYNKTGLFSGRAGFEWSPLEAISLRAGYKTDTTKELSALSGLTVGLGLHIFGQEFAYAWLPYGDLGDTQYFSLLLKFGGKEEERKNLIQYNAIKLHRVAQSMKPEDPEYQQLMRLLRDDEEKTALLPAAGGRQP